jgi:hypothetical protein
MARGMRGTEYYSYKIAKLYADYSKEDQIDLKDSLDYDYDVDPNDQARIYSDIDIILKVRKHYDGSRNEKGNYSYIANINGKTIFNAARKLSINEYDWDINPPFDNDHDNEIYYKEIRDSFPEINFQNIKNDHVAYAEAINKKIKKDYSFVKTMIERREKILKKLLALALEKAEITDSFFKKLIKESNK